MLRKKKLVVFVHPPLSLSGRYAQVAKRIAVPPLGMCWLAAVIRENGYEAAIVDAPALGLDHQETVKAVLALEPDYVGIGATTVLIHSAAKLSVMLKQEVPELPIIVGGIHMTVAPKETMMLFLSFDVGVIGEGEETILELLAALDRDLPLTSVKGLCIRQGGQVVLTENRPFIENLDALPLPAWDLLPNLPEHYQQSFSRIEKLPAASLITSRGCYAKCIFCVRVFGTTIRAHSAVYVIRMIKHLIQDYGIRSLAIEDDNFAIFRHRLRELRDLRRKEWPEITWSCVSRVDVVNPEVLRTMKAMGCWSISYGIESGSQKILDFEKKKIFLEQVERAIHYTKEAGIMAKGYFIIGHPLETKETILETIEFAKRIELDDFQMSYMVPFPGTELYDIANQYGHFDNDWSKMDLWTTPTFVPHGLTADELRFYSQKAMREFYFRPRIIKNYMSRALRNREAMVAYVKEGLRISKFLLMGER